MLKKFFLVLLLVAVAAPVAAFAEVKLNLNYPDFGPFNPSENQSLGALIGYLYFFIVGIAGLAAFVMLVWGGVQWLLSGAIPSQASEAKEKIRNAIIGLLLVLASFLIIQVVNPELTIMNVNLLSLDDRTDLIKWIFSGSGSIAEYRCEYDSGNYFCEGNLPIVAQGSTGPGEQCIVAEDANDSRGNCPSRCGSAGGENARLGDTQSGFTWHCCNAGSGNCNTATETFTFAQTTDRKPLNQVVMRSNYGVYGCDEDGCLSGWRRFLDGASDVCNSPISDSSPKNGDICGQIGSLWIHGPFVAVLYEDVNYGGDRICFDARDQALYPSPPGRLINRLDDCDIGAVGVPCTVGANYGNGWNEDTSSIKILQEGDPEIITLCTNFERTIAP